MEAGSGLAPQAHCDHSHQPLSPSFPGDGVARYLDRVQQQQVAPSAESHDVAAVAKLAEVPARASDGTKMVYASISMEVRLKATPVDQQGGHTLPSMSPRVSSEGPW